MRDRARRKHLIEGSFADAANNHGFKRARWRGLWRQQIQDWLIAAVQNLRILMSKGGKRAGEAAATVVWPHNLVVDALFIYTMGALEDFCTLLPPMQGSFQLFRIMKRLPLPAGSFGQHARPSAANRSRAA